MAHVVVTGASGGLGQALARELAAHGHRVTLVARRRRVLEELARELGSSAHVVAADVRNVEEVVVKLRDAEALLGPIDVLVNNAGTVVSHRFADVSDAEAREVIEVDLLAPLLLARAVLPAMLERRSGTIVNITSTGALGPNPGMVHYCAAKAGLAAASESLRGELRGTGVHVITVYPGPMLTPMLERANAGYPRQRRVTAIPTASPAEVARRVRRGIERGSARVVHPRVYGAFRYLPWLVRWLLDRFTPRPLPRAERSAP